MAFDSNPNFIGVAVIDRNDDLSFDVVQTWFYDLTEMNAKLPKDASTEERAKQTCQRRHGIIHIWKDVFEQAAYLRVGTFVCEKLSFDKKDERMGKEANRQTKNVWHRELSRQTIAGQCTKLGIKLMEVHPAYSSTVGNINYSLVDCINAALELGRRGAFRKLEGAFYPLIAETGLHAMRRMNKRSSGDVEALEGCSGWKELHGVIKEAGLRYRRSLRDLALSGREDATHLRSAKLRYGKIDKHILNLKEKRICFHLFSIVGDV